MNSQPKRAASRMPSAEKRTRVVVGAGSQALAETLKTYPLDTIHVADDGDVDTFCSIRHRLSRSRCARAPDRR
jgi:hypothetical protein